MTSCRVSTTINGDAVEFLCAPEETLLDVLRDGLGLTGSKEGCGSGDCGACSVTLDGRLVCACLVLGAEAEGRSIETIEGMADGKGLHPLQSKFLEHAALQCGVCTPGILVAAKALLERNPAPSQCGVCTPGILVAAKALLERNPAPSETEVRYWLAGNLCRCTGYDKIVRAVLDAATEMAAGMRES
jgi:carbon-monoxide dehydrogenase small subunit